VSVVELPEQIAETCGVQTTVGKAFKLSKHILVIAEPQELLIKQRNCEAFKLTFAITLRLAEVAPLKVLPFVQLVKPAPVFTCH
jgi:hypothetical protein